MAKKLRGQGPKTFVSYSFGNKLAPQLAEHLAAEGFQVTLVVDTSLLGEPSLAGALERHIQEAEIVVPILDEKANKSNWVRHELTIAKDHQRVMLPVVLSTDSLPDLVSDIPYLTEDTLHALIPAALKNFALLRLDPEKPYELLTPSISDYLRSDRQFTRIILDSDDFMGTLAEGMSETVGRATEKQPELRPVIEQQVRKPLERCLRMTDRVQSIVPRFRAAVENALSRYGPERVERSIPSWQRMTRLLIGQELLAIAATLPPDLFPEFWGTGAGAVSTARKQLKAMKSTHTGNESVEWGLQLVGNEASRGWLDVYFQTTRGDDFRGFIPASDHISVAVRCRERPDSFFEPYQWADFGLPQLMRRAILLADRFSAEEFIKAVAWDLSDYESSSPP